MKKTLFLWVCLLSFGNATAYAAFVSGSTGALGAFDPQVNTEVDLPPDGILNYTTINVPANVTVTFKKNAANTPVYMLATGDVAINGKIDVSGTNAVGTNIGRGGPGGFNGGSAGSVGGNGGKGLGPGGGFQGNYNNGQAGGGGFGTSGVSGWGTAYDGAGGSTYGNVRLLPLIGGSGGGGGGGTSASASSPGGGGGGAILIASSSSISLMGSIYANGGNGGTSPGGGAGGSGGGVKLVANTISGTGSVSANGGAPGYQSGRGGGGIVRFETVINTFSSTTSPSYTYGLPGDIFLSNMPSLNITSIAGGNVPASSTGAYNQPDIVLPNTTTNPVAVGVSATNIPDGTTVTIKVTPQFGNSSSVNTALSGSAAIGNVTLSTLYTNVITAEVTFTVVAMYYDGEEINKVRVATKLGGGSETTYITKSGKEIKGELVAALR